MEDLAVMLNAMTVDLEDWAQAVLDPRLPVTDRVVANVDQLLAFLDHHGVRATFFALGRVCEQYPLLLARVAAAGHEIASHGYGHQLVYNQTPLQFELDVARSVDIITDQIGKPPIGYRAPAFSITEQTPWAPDVLSRIGIKYSSSVFPIQKRRYGIPTSPVVPYRWPEAGLLEFPMTTLRFAGRNWPVCGGGYMRLLPAWVHAQALRDLNEHGYPGVVYLHPYELTIGEVDRFKRSGFRVSMRRHLTQSLWRSRVAPRLSRLFEEFAFAPMAEVLGLQQGSRPVRRPQPIRPSYIDALAPLAIGCA
jgi:polysaccharide deacetylase family protein (PEP-CTERM system associated)